MCFFQTNDFDWRLHVNLLEWLLTRALHSLSLSRRKISAHEFERGGLLKPIVNTIDGTPTFLSINSQHDLHNHHHHPQSGLVQNQNGTTNSIISRTQRLSRNELRHLDEKELIFELVSKVKIYVLYKSVLFLFLLPFYRSRIFVMSLTWDHSVIKSFKTCQFF